MLHTSCFLILAVPSSSISLPGGAWPSPFFVASLCHSIPPSCPPAMWPGAWVLPGWFNYTRLQEAERDRWTAEDGARKFKQDFANKADMLQRQIAQREKQLWVMLSNAMKILKSYTNFVAATSFTFFLDKSICMLFLFLPYLTTYIVYNYCNLEFLFTANCEVA